MIYLSGPSSLQTPVDLMRENSVLSVNSSAGYLIDNNVPVFAYVACDGSFYKNGKDLFTNYSSYAKYTFISKIFLNKPMVKKKNHLSKSVLFCITSFRS